MKNMMKEYLGNDYSSNHLRNFCLYWIKAFECKASYPSEDEWRRENDLDCLYFDGDLKADTLMSAWTPIKWVANCLNRDIGISFCKTSRIHSDPYHDLKLLAEDGDSYLPSDHELVKLLNRFLELAELRCNFILLPKREMNPDRYRIMIGCTTVWLCDEVPATLAHLFDPESLGKYFPDREAVDRWIRREHLEMGFADGKIDLYHVRPLIKGHDPYTPLWLEKEEEIAQALEYMIEFLEERMKILIDIENGAAIREDETDSGEYTENVSEKIGDGIYIGELDIHPYRGDCFDPPEDEDMENINPIRRQKYHVWDGTNRTLPANPKVKYVRDFDDLIDRLEYASDTIFDLLWLYNISGLIVEKVVKYQDPESDFGIRVAFTIFGTYVKENDTDEYYPEAETGPYNLGNSSDWNSETDLSMWMEETRSMKYLKKDVRKFYDTTGLNLD